MNVFINPNTRLRDAAEDAIDTMREFVCAQQNICSATTRGYSALYLFFFHFLLIFCIKRVGTNSSLFLALWGASDIFYLVEANFKRLMSLNAEKT